MTPITNNKEIFVTTDKLFKAFGYSSHQNLKKIIKSNTEIFNAFGAVREIEQRSESKIGGRPSSSYALNLNHLLVLTALCKNKKDGIKSKILPFIVDAYANASLLNILNLISSMDLDEVEDDKFVYVAREEFSGRYKIGISKNPEARIKALNTGNPERLVLVHAYLAIESRHKSESLAHAVYEDSRLKGEWFSKGIDLSLLPSYSITCNIESGHCDCMDCSNYQLVADSVDNLGSLSRDSFIGKAIDETGLSFNEVARHIDALEDTGVISFAEIIGKSYVHELQLEDKS